MAVLTDDAGLVLTTDAGVPLTDDNDTVPIQAGSLYGAISPSLAPGLCGGFADDEEES